MRKTKKTQIIDNLTVAEASLSDNTATRRNAAGSIERTDRFKNIDDGLVPFKTSAKGYGQGHSSVSVKEAVVLCQKAYYNFSIFRNIIDLMTEFSTNNIYLRGGNAKARGFVSALLNKINITSFQEKFFREYFRSGNVFYYRFDSEIDSSEINKITQVYGTDQMQVEKLVIPSRYIILNPADIQLIGTANFGSGIYQKILTDFELAALRNAKTEEDIEVFNSLPKDIQKNIKSQNPSSVVISLNQEKVGAVFYKKQDYEPFAVPMGYPVLEDINAKAELKKMDMAIARVMQQMILLITTGAEPDKGGINPGNIKALQDLFKNQTVGRVIVADYTTKAQFVIPDVSAILDPKKYEVLDNDINIGLNNVFSGGEKFANQQQKVELFVARLKQARNAFLNDFLQPEIKRICKSVGFKNFPTAYFEDFELKDNTNYAKIYARLMELGILTPEEGFRAIETNTLPDPEMMEENQREYKKRRDAGLYQPLIGGGAETPNSDGTGRPSGSSGIKKTTNKITPIGASDVNYSLTKIKENLILATETEELVKQILKEKNGLKRLSNKQKDVAREIVKVVCANETPDNWKSKAKDYCDNPIDTNPERIDEVHSIAVEHQLDPYMASILLASKIE